MIICFFMKAINSWTSTETYTLYLGTAELEVNIGSSRRGPIMTLSETPSKEQHRIVSSSSSSVEHESLPTVLSSAGLGKVWPA
jgi:hypothetical protein